MPRKPLDAKAIKSAKRVVEVFEFFNEFRTEGTVMQIAREYGYPQSSTSELLACLAELGLLYHDRYARTYRPTPRVAALGAWVQPELFRKGAILPMMDGLRAATGSAVILGGIVGTSVQAFHAVRGAAGSRMPPIESLLHGAMGKLLLSAEDFGGVAKLVHRLNAEAAPEWRVRCTDLLEEFFAIRRKGYAVDLPSGDQPGLCTMLIPQVDGSQRLALATVINPGAAAAIDDHVHALRRALTGPLDAIEREPGHLLAC